MALGSATASNALPRADAPPERSAAQLSLLGAFQLHCSGRAVRVPPSAQRVVAFLALHARPVTRVLVAGSLWMDHSEERAGAALRTALWRIGSPAALLVRSDGQFLSLHRSVAVDIAIAARRAEDLLADGEAGGARVPSREDVMLLRDSGDLLPGWYEDWVVIERERFRQLRMHALEALCRRLSRDGHHAEATEAGIAAIACEPLRESAHRALVAAHIAEGNAGEALRQYRICRDLIARSLGLEPTAELERLVAPWRRP